MRFSTRDTTLLGKLYFRAMSNKRQTIRCVLYGLGGTETSNAINIDIKHWMVYFTASSTLFIVVTHQLVDYPNHLNC